MRELSTQIRFWTGKYEFCERFHFIVVVMYSGAGASVTFGTLTGK